MRYMLTFPHRKRIRFKQKMWSRHWGTYWRNITCRFYIVGAS